jgi:lysophospholipase L1-like esterase
MYACFAGYVALGDSFAAGVGNDQSTYLDGSACHRSSKAWPALLAVSLADQDIIRKDDFVFVACGGATIQSITDSQVQQVDGSNPKVVTLTAGGRDVHLVDAVLLCLKFPSCKDPNVPLNGTELV